MRKVLTLLSAALVGLSGLFMAPAMATADSAPSAAPTIGYAVGDAMLGTGGSAQHLTFSMVDRSSGDRGTVSYTNASAGVAYDAGVMAVVATNSEARFAYTIPSTAPTSVSGLIIVWQVRNSSPDTAGFSVAATAGQALTMVGSGFTPSNSYTVSSGGLDTAMTSSTGLRGYAFGNAAFGTTPRQHLAFAVLDYGPTMDTGVAFYANLDSSLVYQAATPVVRVAYSQARFAYTIPAGFPGLSGLPLAWKVVNGVPDAAGFSVATSAASAASMVNVGFTPTYGYRLTGGDLTVVQLYLLLGHATGGVWFGSVGASQQMTFQVFDYAWTADRGTVAYRNLSANVAYVATVLRVRVAPSVAYFDYVIPTGSLKGTVVVWRVVDVRNGYDRVGFSVASSLSAAHWMVAHGFTPTNQYTVTHGNLTVHMP
ncbi:hypothetical protein GCM10025782_09830 [Pedococcus ginsenosidimutans]|uniref:Uncharacterized protein n=1 Tax=Pedococcus ginsenosidimutans TaxID=490570 RepID=A0ABP8XX92_9MICO